MKKKKAINILKSQIEKSNIKENNIDRKFIYLTQTRSCIKRIFGDDSHEYKFVSKYNPSIGEDIDLTVFLNSCIETVENFGVIKQNSLWRRLESMNQMVLWSIISFIVVAIFTMGVISTKINF